MKGTKIMTHAAVGVLCLLVGYLFGNYGTLEPCAMLQQEAQNQILSGQLDRLGDVPDMVSNNGDQLWCSQKFAELHLP